MSTAVNSVPKFEGGEMEVFSSTQALMDCQRWVAQVGFISSKKLKLMLIGFYKVTGVPRNRIVARGKRMGGGFGGKESRSSHVHFYSTTTLPYGC
jgi:xanthine dehydrogenase/oxidase